MLSEYRYCEILKIFLNLIKQYDLWIVWLWIHFMAFHSNSYDFGALQMFALTNESSIQTVASLCVNWASRDG